MTVLDKTDKLFFGDAGMDPQSVVRIVTEGLAGADIGELFLERAELEFMSYADGGETVNKGNQLEEGFGIRYVADRSVAFQHANEISETSIEAAAKTVSAIRIATPGTIIVAPAEAAGPVRQPLYSSANPFEGTTDEDKIKFLTEVDRYVRSKDPSVRQVTVSFSSSYQAVQIIGADGHRAADLRPMARCRIEVIAERNGRKERGGSGFGGRIGLASIFDDAAWKPHADHALRRALTNLESVDAPSGEMTVVLGPGWPGVMLHEAVGHGLESDACRTNSSVFAGRIGQQVAAKGVTVIDQGDIPDRRGSLYIDDEGTPTQKNVLIEDGILRGYMQDKFNARLTRAMLTGNGRRENHSCLPIPRMTNTYMESGPDDPAAIIASVDYGVYAPYFGGGQVDPVSGKFVFEMEEAYLIENGKITTPLKGATLIGRGSDSMNKIIMIGNDLALDAGIGMCGKEGQSVPVSLGQPTVRMDDITVGGTAAGPSPAP